VRSAASRGSVIRSRPPVAVKETDYSPCRVGQPPAIVKREYCPTTSEPELVGGCQGEMSRKSGAKR